MRRLAAMLAVFLPSGAGADTMLLLEDREGLPPPYFQRWYATPATDDMPTRNVEVYIRGAGKHGDFFGVLYLDCIAPRYSEWLVTGGHLTPDEVPGRAIGALRQRLCGS